MIFPTTIAAIATPYGRGGIATIRISGSDAIAVADAIFRAKNGKQLVDIPTNRVVYGEILNQNTAIDDGVATIFRAPHSYTGEDTVEISCHGGILITETVLSSILASGAVQAGPGEFTKRAFVNGKLTLTEAEAVIDLIDAETDDQMKLARQHTSGILSKELSSIYEELLTLVSQAYVFADYPDEDLTDLAPDEIKKELIRVRSRIEALLSTYTAGHAIADGIYTVVAGKPNTGKSSLMNALLGKERAIVSDVAGTTRDYLEEKATIHKIRLILVDTAGIHESDDKVEKIGIDRSVSALEKAELVLAVFDASVPISQEDIEFIDQIASLKVPKIAILNKSDKECDESQTYHAHLSGFHTILSLSAKTQDGMERLKNEIENLFIAGDIDYSKTAIVSNARQKSTLLRAKTALDNAIDALNNGFTQDIAGLDIENAMSALGDVDGRTVTGDIVDSIFHRFCVGK